MKHDNLFDLACFCCWFSLQLLLMERKLQEVHPLLTLCGQIVENWQGNPIQKESLRVFFLVLQVTHYLDAGQVSESGWVWTVAAYCHLEGVKLVWHDAWFDRITLGGPFYLLFYFSIVQIFLFYYASGGFSLLIFWVYFNWSWWFITINFKHDNHDTRSLWAKGQDIIALEKNIL